MVSVPFCRAKRMLGENWAAGVGFQWCRVKYVLWMDLNTNWAYVIWGFQVWGGGGNCGIARCELIWIVEFWKIKFIIFFRMMLDVFMSRANADGIRTINLRIFLEDHGLVTIDGEGWKMYSCLLDLCYSSLLRCDIILWVLHFLWKFIMAFRMMIINGIYRNSGCDTNFDEINN